MHAQHHLGFVPDDSVVRGIVVAETAVEPFAATIGLEFAASPIMLTA